MNPLLAAGLIQYAAITAPVFVPAVADAPQTCDRWKPTYADRVPARPRTIDYSPGHRAPVFVPNVTVLPFTWQPSYPSRVPRVRLLAAEQPSYQAPPFQPPPLFDSGGAIIATAASNTCCSIRH